MISFDSRNLMDSSGLCFRLHFSSTMRLLGQLAITIRESSQSRLLASVLPRLMMKHELNCIFSYEIQYL